MDTQNMPSRSSTNYFLASGKISHDRKFHALLRLLQYGDQNGYGKRFEEETKDQEGKSRGKEKAQGETLKGKLNARVQMGSRPRY
jgi:hypothetical protein